MMKSTSILLTLGGLFLLASSSFGQQRIGYVDSEYILSQIPEYEAIQQSLDRTALDMEEELNEQQEEIRTKFEEFRSRELLYTNAERDRKRQEIESLERELEKRRIELFGPTGELFRRQEELMKPLHERVFAAMEEVAINERFDYLFDISGDYLFMYAREDLNMSNAVLDELGINVAARTGAGSREN